MGRTLAGAAGQGLAVAPRGPRFWRGRAVAVQGRRPVVRPLRLRLGLLLRLPAAEEPAEAAEERREGVRGRRRRRRWRRRLRRGRGRAGRVRLCGDGAAAEGCQTTGQNRTHRPRALLGLQPGFPLPLQSLRLQCVWWETETLIGDDWAGACWGPAVCVSGGPARHLHRPDPLLVLLQRPPGLVRLLPLLLAARAVHHEADDAEEDEEGHEAADGDADDVLQVEDELGRLRGVGVVGGVSLGRAAGEDPRKMGVGF